MVKRTFQPNVRRRKKTHGFRSRLKRTLKRRMKKGRHKLIP
jgi:large subunit ribosomal protein L34